MGFFLYPLFILCHEHYMRVVMNVVNIVKNVMTDEKGHLIFLVLSRVAGFEYIQMMFLMDLAKVFPGLQPKLF